MSNYSLVPDVNRRFPIVDIWEPTVKPDVLRMYTESWVPLEHRRRLSSYILLHAIYNNSHSHFLQRGNETLEYGDAALVVDTLRDALLGSMGIKITSPDIETNKVTQNRISRLKKWWKSELMDTKIFENETNCSALGDSIYRLRWSNKPNKKATVKVDTFDPGFFFPVFDDDDDLAMVFLAWEELVVADDGVEERQIYKEKYELIDGICYVTAGWYKKFRNDSINEYLYTLDDLELIRYKTNQSDEPLDSVSLGIDFIPIIYVPNINVQGEPYGKSDLAIAVDLLGEIANSNTDMAANTSLLGSPPLVLKSDGSYGDTDEEGNSQVATVGPGQVIEVGASGDAHLLDVSEINSALDSYLKRLDQKLFENTRATKLAAGKMEGSAIPSGISLRLMQNPLVQKTLPKRILRSYKLGLLVKFVQKMFVVFGEPADKLLFNDNDDEFEVNIEFGDIFPTDRSQAITDISVAYTGGFLSLETAIRMCVKYGIDIEDVKEEVARIKKEREEENTFTNVGTNNSSNHDGTQSSNMQTTKDGETKSDSNDE